MKTTGNKLKMDTGEVSIVDKGANKKGRFPIFKTEEEMEFKEVLEAVLKTESDTDKPLSEVLKDLEISDKGAEALTAVVKTLDAFKGEIPEGAIEKAMAAAGFAKPEEEEDDNMKKKVKKSNEAGEGKSTEEPVSKEFDKLPDEVRALVTKELEKRDAALEIIKSDNETLKATLKVEKDARELAEWTEKARNELSHYPGKSTEELGAMFKRLSDSDTELANEQFENYKASSEAMKASNVLKEVGSIGADVSSGSAWDKIVKMAEGLVEKSAESDFTIEKATELVIERNPKLYTEYLNESGGN